MNEELVASRQSFHNTDMGVQLCVKDFERIFLTALDSYYSPWSISNCRWTLLYLLWLRSTNYAASEDAIMDLLNRGYILISENSVPIAWDIAIWHSPTNYTRVFHAGLVLENWFIRSKEWPELTDPISDKRPDELDIIIESAYQKLSLTPSNYSSEKYTQLRFYRRK